jgi:hypothetical protein
VAIFASGSAPTTPLDAVPRLRRQGLPLTDNEASTVVPGRFCCGVPFLRTPKSSVLFGVGEDAAMVAQSITRNQSPHRTAKRPN